MGPSGDLVDFGRPCEPGVGRDGRVRDKAAQPAVFKRVSMSTSEGLCPFPPQVRSKPQVCPTGDTCSFIRFEMSTGAPQGLPGTVAREPHLTAGPSAPSMARGASSSAPRAGPLQGRPRGTQWRGWGVVRTTGLGKGHSPPRCWAGLELPASPPLCPVHSLYL